MKDKYLKVLSVLLEWLNESYDEMWHGYGTLEDETDISIKELKKIMKELRRAGIVYYSYCVTDEGLPCGSGNFIKELLSKESPERLYEIYEECIKC